MPSVWNEAPSSAVRRLTAAGLVLVLALTLGTGTAMAGEASGSTSGTSSGVIRVQVAEATAQLATTTEKVKSASREANQLTADLKTSEQRAKSLEQQGKAAASNLRSIQRQIDQHNATVNSYPGRKAPPAIAQSVNARGRSLGVAQSSALAQVRAVEGQYSAAAQEHDALVSRGEALIASAQWLEAELQQQAARLADLNVALAQSLIAAQTGAPLVADAPGGDPAPPPAAADRGVEAPKAGGDPIPRHEATEAIQQYATEQGGTVDPAPATVILTPGSPAGASGPVAVDLPVDALVRTPSGKNTAVVATLDGKLPENYAAFNRAIGSGDPATVVRGGERVAVSKVAAVATNAADDVIDSASAPGLLDRTIRQGSLNKHIKGTNEYATASASDKLGKTTFAGPISARRLVEMTLDRGTPFHDKNGVLKMKWEAGVTTGFSPDGSRLTGVIISYSKKGWHGWPTNL